MMTRARLYRRLMGTALCAALLVGCAPVGPDFVRPNSPVVKQWIEVNTPSAGQSGLTSRSAPVVKWW